ncbi:MAG: two-component sensor histidine kinase [Desulfovibrionaceae bacterium]|nr:two-component sensor histidine kinase [Desulfovibrionaceae bacterium]
MTNETKENNGFSMGIIRFLSWISLVLILVCNIVLSALITNHARELLLQKQKDFGTLLAQSADYQIHRRYSIPLTMGSRPLQLSDRTPSFEPLEQVLSSVFQGAKIDSTRIFSWDSTVTYSTFASELGKRNIASPAVERVRNAEEPDLEVISAFSGWKSLFALSPEPGAFILRVTYPLSTQNRLLSFEGDGPKLDILEFSQDITEDYTAIIRFQWSILALAVISSLILFALLQLFIRRTEKVLSARVQEKERLERELHQSEKLASMGRVVSSIAHEIRNPLGIIRSTAEHLLRRNEKSGTDKTSSALLGAIYDESCRLSTTITDFLDYARPKKLVPQPVDLPALLNQALVFLGNSLEKNNIKVREELPPHSDGVWVMGDKDLLYRAVYNILANAGQAMEHDGEIRIEISEIDGKIQLCISDSGPGFSEEALLRGLDPFFTTKEDGTGLGLAIVQSIILSHEGEIFISNRSAGGAMVCLTLPKADPQENKPSPVE